MRVRRSMAGIATILAATLVLTACGGDDDDGDAGSDSNGGDKGNVVIGSAGFTEIELMAQMYALLLEDAGYTTEVQVVENRELYEPALEDGAIDVVPDYAATMTEFLNAKVNGADAEQVADPDVDATVEALRSLAEPLGLTVLEASEAADQNAFVVTTAFAEENDLETLSDLAALGQPVVLAATEECPTRQFCQLALEEYGIQITEVLPTGFGSVQTKDAVKEGTAQLGLTGTTDATLDDFELVILDDDKSLQLADNLIPIVGSEYGDDGDFADALNSLSAALTTEDLTELNRKVDAERMTAEDVARQFLEDNDLIG
ncbi:MAG: ABC transporter substrate-binding protein [Candidatus Nanopelagicales bacterium]